MASNNNGPQGERTARVHGRQSNRKAKERVESKTVFKSVLDNPFDVKWPVIALNVQNAILARVVELMQGVAEFNLDRQKRSKADKRRRKAETKSMRASHTDAIQEADDARTATSTTPAVSPPGVLQRITVGINEVTKRLEAQCSIPRQYLVSAGDNEGRKDGDGDGDGDQTKNDVVCAPTPKIRESIRVVLVCRSDIDPPLLISHIPHLVAACNSNPKSPATILKLVTLPKGAEFSLAQTMGLRRVAVMALDESLSKDENLSSLLSSVPPVLASWLAGLGDNSLRSISKTKNEPPKRAQVLRRRLVPTHIKQLRTTAPKDMRAAKALRAKGRAEAKAKRKAKERTNKMKTSESTSGVTAQAETDPSTMLVV